MFEKLLEKILKDVLGEFIDGIDTKKLNIGIWSGSVEIVNVSLKPKLLATFGLPFRIAYSNISRLSIIIPWKNLFSAPLVIEIDHVLVLAENQICVLSQQEETKLCLLKMKQFIQKLAREIAKTRKDEAKSAGYFDTVYLKMLDNLYLTIKNVHVRFQITKDFSDKDNKIEPFSCGIGIKSLELYAVDEKQAKVFIDRTKLPAERNQIRKKINVSLGAYWNSKEETMFIGLADNPNQSAAEKNKQEVYYKKMLDLQQEQVKLNYFISLECQGVITQENVQGKISQYSIKINIKDLSTQIHQRMIQNSLTFYQEASLRRQQLKMRKSSFRALEWENPEGKQFRLLLQRYCVSEFWSTEPSSAKNVQQLSEEQNAKFLRILRENRDNMDQIYKKIKQIILGDLGAKNNISKSQIMKNWHKIQEIFMEERQQNSENYQINFSLFISAISLSYSDQLKRKVITLAITDNGCLFVKTLSRQIDADIRIGSLKLQGVNQVDLITIGKSNSRADSCAIKIIKQSSAEGLENVQVIVGTISTNYDFSTFFQLSKIHRMLLKNAPDQSRGGSTSEIERKISKKMSVSSETKIEEGKIQEAKPAAMRILVEFSLIELSFSLGEGVSWKFQMQGSSLQVQSFGEGKLAVHLMLQGIHVLSGTREIVSPFKVALLYDQTSDLNQDLKVEITSIKLLIEPKEIKNVKGLLHCLTNLKKSTAFDISSFHEEVFVLQKEIWKKYDAIIVNDSLYLYEKEHQYPSAVLQIITVEKIKLNKKDVIVVGLQGDKKLKLTVRKQETLQSWIERLNLLQVQNQTALSKVKNEQELSKEQTNDLSTFRISLAVDEVCIQMPTSQMIVSIKSIGVDKQPGSQTISIECGQIYCACFNAEILKLAEGNLGRSLRVLMEKKDNLTLFNVQFYSQLAIEYRPAYIHATMLQLQAESHWFSDSIEIQFERQQQLQQLQGVTSFCLDFKQIEKEDKSAVVTVNFYNIHWEQQKEPPAILRLQFFSFKLLIDSQIRLQSSSFNVYQRMCASTSIEAARQDFKELLRSAPGGSPMGIKLTQNKDEMIVHWVNPYFADYHQEMTLRVIDYLLVQVKDVLLSPMNFAPMKQKRKQGQRNHTRYYLLEHYLASKLKQSEIKNRISAFTKLQVRIDNISLDIRTDSILSTLVQCQKIQVTNQVTNIYNPSIKESAVHQVYLLEFFNLNILVDAKQSQMESFGISRRNLLKAQINMDQDCGKRALVHTGSPFDFSMKVVMMSHYAEYKALHSSFAHDGALKVDLRASSLVLSRFNNSFNLLLFLKALDSISSNIQKSDGLKEVYSYDEHMMSLVKKQGGSQFEFPPSYTSFKLDIDSIQAAFLEDRKDIQKDSTQFKADLESIHLEYVDKEGSSIALTLNKFGLNLGSELQIVGVNELESESNRETVFVGGRRKDKVVQMIPESLKNVPDVALRPAVRYERKKKIVVTQESKQTVISTSVAAERVTVLYNPRFIVFAQNFIYNYSQLTEMQILHSSLETEAFQPNIRNILSVAMEDIYLKVQMPPIKSAPVILCLLADIQVGSDAGKLEVTVPYLETYLSFGGDDGAKKKTLLQPTSLHYLKKDSKLLDENKIERLESEQTLKVEKCFMKVSILDIRKILKFLSTVPQEIPFLQANHRRKSRNRGMGSSLKGGKNNETDKRLTPMQHRSLEALTTSNLSKRSAENKKHEIDFKFEPMQFVVVNEVGNSNYPLIYASLNILHFSDQIINLNTKINYFNLRIKGWEPLLESSAFKITLNPHVSIEKIPASQLHAPEGSQKQKVEVVEEPIDNFINLNISTNFLESVLTSLYPESSAADQPGQDDSLYEDIKSDGDEMNCVVIINQLGYRIVCKTFLEQNLSKKIKVPNGKSKKVTFLDDQNDWEDSLTQNQEVSHGSVLIKDKEGKPKESRNFFELEINGEFVIKDIDMGEVGIKKLVFSKEGSPCCIYKHIYIDISKNVRFIKFYSEVMIKNMTKLPLCLKNSRAQSVVSETIGPKGSCTECLMLQAEKQTFLPYDQLGDIRGLGESMFSDLIMTDHNTEEHLKGNQEEQHSAEYDFLIVKENKKFRTIFKILPTCKIVSKLPESIDLAFKAGDSIKYWFTLGRDESQELYQPYRQLELSVHIDEYQWTDFYPCTNISEVVLVDFGGNRVKVFLAKYLNEDKVPIIFIYPNIIIRNDCEKAIFVRDPDAPATASPIKVMSGLSRSLCNNRILIFKPEDSQAYNKVVLSQEEALCKFDVKNGEQAMERASQVINLNQKMLKTFHTIDDSAKVSTRFLSVSHRIVFSNLTSHPVIIRKYNRKDLINNVRVYQPNQTKSLLLFEEDYESPNLFQIALRDTPYEWSGALSFTNSTTASYDFILRDRCDCRRVLFLNLMLIKYNKMDKYKLQLTQCEQQEVPYIIKNELVGFVVRLPDYGDAKILPGEQLPFSWDEPILKSGIITLILETEERGKKITARHLIKTEQRQQSSLVKFKNLSVMAEVSLTQQRFTNTYVVREYEVRERTTERLRFDINLPLRIAFINNSFTPATHLLDFSTHINVRVSEVSDELLLQVALQGIQVDNHSKYRVYFPVVLSTEINASIYLGANTQIEVNSEPITLNLEEDFGKEVYAAISLITAKASRGDELARKSERDQGRQSRKKAKSQFFISKLKLPPIKIFLQVKTSKLSIETTVKLDQPPVTKYPWAAFPYPVSKIVINLLSHLSISPWSVISSFHQGVTSLLTEQQAMRGFEGFFGQIIAGVSNSISGIIGIVVGHDIQRVDNFFDGIDQGTSLLWQQIKQIKDCFEPEECTLPAVLKSTGVGMCSIIFKPVKGILQMTLKITEGVKKTAQFSFETYAKTCRLRNRILFHGLEQKFMNYDPIQSSYLAQVTRAYGENIKYFHFVKFYVLENNVNSSIKLLAVGTDQIILVNLRKEKLIWDVAITENLQVRLRHLTTLVLNDEDHEVDLIHQELAQEVVSLIRSLQERVVVKS